MPFNLNLDNRDFREDGPIANADLPRRKVRDVVAAIDFINTVHTSFFDHGFSTAGPLLRRLQQQTN